MPTEESLRCYEERAPQLTRDETGEQGDQRAVGPAEARPGYLPAQHCQLVAQHDDLGILRQSVHLVDTEERKGGDGRGSRGRTGPRSAAWPSLTVSCRHADVVMESCKALR